MPHSIQQVNGKFKFKNVHGNYFEDFVALARVYNDPNKSNFDAYNETSESIKEIIKEALEKRMRIRACGSLWSLSKIPYVEGMNIFSRGENDDETMKVYHFLENSDLEAASQEKEYLFSQCGNTIKNLNTICFDNRRSLQTSGASNGQTIAGVIGTGVHGSSIHVGSIQDTVYGLHIINGPNPEDSIYLEAASHPVANAAFAAKINATLVRDDELFNAALIGLGAFGYVHGVLVQTVEEFDLMNYTRKVDISKVYEFIKTMDVKNNGLNMDNHDPDDLFHMKFYINQYDLKNVVAEIIYKPTVRRVVFPPKFLKYNKDFTFTMAKSLAGLFPFMIPGQINKQLPKEGEQGPLPLGEIFTDTTNIRDGQFSCAAAVEITDAERMLKLMLEEADNNKKIPSTFSLRFVKKSKATLAFTRYNMNCLFGIDGVETKASRNFLAKASEKLISSGIPHSWHWGKFNYLDRDYVIRIYGNDRVRWINARTRFFKDPVVAQLFTNDFLHERGLT